MAQGPPWSDGTHFWKQAGLYVRRQGNVYAVVSVKKGGVLVLYEGERLAYTDSGLVGQQADGQRLVTHLEDDYEHEIGEDRVRIKGAFGYVGGRLPTPLTVSLFHLGMITLGRFWSNAVRGLLQKLLIVGKKAAPLVFQRTIEFAPQATLTDEIWDLRPQRDGSGRLTALFAGTDHTSIYVAMSNAFQSAALLPWTDYSALLEPLRLNGYAKISRKL